MATLGELPSKAIADEEQAKRFDLIVLQRELAQLEGDENTAQRTRERIQSAASLLLEKTTIPAVAGAAELLECIAGDEWWESVTLKMLEHARHELRGLMQYLDKKQRKTIVVDWEDELGQARTVDLALVAVGVDQKRFEEKIRAYIREHSNHIAIQRLRRNKPLTQSDIEELERILVEQGEGTPEALAKISGERGLGIFIRSLVGLDREAAEAAFAARIAFSGLTSTQMDFLRHIIDELTRRGEMEPSRLFEPPYSEQANLQYQLVFPEARTADMVFETLRAIETSAQPAA
ncbi:type I restriction-modification enzyme R subunit C-terminal domain-containing protein [Leucobacter coleopterorum]|uniref:type I restriction-modification enzyme R subunit C-terminal domain-containing protein n=1 Tax=Leucobacter coleopterorum TaxID=2714933 RepID=UPI001FCA852D|nr:type I restriction-modification enzyme R subunit C-terminal domain-containing protein [Leucobacter coleopterorum]